MVVSKLILPTAPRLDHQTGSQQAHSLLIPASIRDPLRSICKNGNLNR
jgi:hypothetical protein